MTNAVRTLEDQALRLAEDERADLARRLLLSLVDESTENRGEHAWIEEVKRRDAELRTGAVEAVPHELVMREARERFG